LKKNLIEISDEVFIPIYKRFPVIFDHGDGIYLYDTDGKEYLDFASGVGRVKKLANKTQCDTDIQHNRTKIRVS